MSLPPVPPRPTSGYGPQRQNSDKPPLPPLPPQLVHEAATAERHQTFAAPRPQRYGNPATDMAQRLEYQLGPQYPSATPNLQPGFSNPYFPPQPPPQRYGPSPAPPQPPAAPYGASPYLPQQYPQSPPQGYPPPQPWGPQPPALNTQYQSPAPYSGPTSPGGFVSSGLAPSWGPPPSQNSQPPSFPTGPSVNSLSSSLVDLSFHAPSVASQPQSPAVQRDPSPDTKPRDPNAMFAPLPTVASLTASAQQISTSSDPATKVKWAKDVLALVDRTLPAAKQKGETGSKISDPDLVKLTDLAIQHILNIAGNASAGGSVPSFVAHALYLRGNLSSSGSFPAYLPRDPRSAFKDFEQSARAGYSPAWFKLGRDYESVHDTTRARECFERGLAQNETSCLYRLGMANLLGQINMPKNPQLALTQLRQAAEQANLDVPQPAYVFGMILLGEFDQVDVPIPLIMSLLPQASPSNPDPRQAEAKKWIEQAAYYSFAPAQYKLGWAYEYAKIGCPYDPLLSVQYYSHASQQGETEADMALSKWFLCGSEGAFEKDEVLAVTFAEKAAKKGLPSAEFAMGYYCEVGIGGPKDLDAAQKWYQRATKHGNPDAAQRLSALQAPTPQALSRAEHDKLTDTTLVRKRTAAKEYSMANGRGAGERKGTGGEMVEARRLAAAARKEASEAPMAADGLPMPTYPSSNPNSPRQSPRRDPQQLDSRPQLRNQDSSDALPPAGRIKDDTGKRYPSPSRDDGRIPSPLRQGQQALPGGRFQGQAARRQDRQSPDGRRPGEDRRPNASVDFNGSGSGGIILPGAAPQRRPNAGTANTGHRQSFALKDDGPVFRPGTSPVASPAQRPQATLPPSSIPPAPSQQASSSSVPPAAPTPIVTSPAPKKGPATFQEMGFTSAPVQDDKCLIM